MAIDSALKRKAIAGAGRPYMRSHGNDAAVGRAWRANSGHAYPVANFASPAGPTNIYPVFSEEGHSSLVFGGVVIR